MSLLMRLKDQPLHKKLRYALLVTSGTAMVLAFLALGIGITYKLRADTFTQLTTLARAVSLNLQAALAFGDQSGGATTLAALRAHKDIDFACVIRADGSKFVEYTIKPGNRARCARQVSPSGWFANQIELVEPIILDKERIGELHVIADISDTWRDLLAFLAGLAVLSAGALVAAVLIGRRFRPFLTDPILELASTAERISHEKNYELRARKTSEDEVGRLIESFNAMLSEIQKRDEQLAQHRENLEKQVEARTAELRESMEAAQAASRAKSQFLATMSHEIRTPMNGVLGMTELLLDSELNATQRRYGETIHQSGESLLSIINDILDFSKIEAGRMELESIAYNPGRLLYEVADLLAQRAGEKGLELICTASPDTPKWVWGDPNRVRQIITNLVGNAIKFTERGEIVLSLEPVEAPAGDEPLIKFSVRDSGIGIAPEAVARLFQAFSQADNSHARRFGGTGLGLAIAKELSHLMGGSIGVDSTPGMGSTFWFTLGAPHADVAPTVSDRDIFQDVRVLAVDDIPANLEILSRQLGALGMTCDSLDDPRQTLERLRAAQTGDAPYLLALIDMKMPVMSGIELAGAIRADTALDATSLILLSSQSEEGQLGKALAAGFCAVLQKPVRMEELADCIERVLRPPSSDPLPITTPFPEEENLDGTHVLLAEDNPVNQSLALAHLRKLGCRVTLANNGLEALAAYRREPFDLILMDCQMPEMDGYEATRMIRADETDGRRIPIIAVTANAMQGDREVCLACGMDDFLPKPYKQNQLKSLLEHWVRLDEAGGATQPQHNPGNTSQGVAPSMGSTLNPEVLDELSRQLGADNPDLIRELIRVYLDNALQLLKDMDAALVSGVAKDLMRAAHSLKSSSAILGVMRLSVLSKEIELAARNGEVAGQADSIIHARNEFAAAAVALEARLNG
jgi:two-component system, sensor histidine kinase and response regulator